MLEPSNFRIRAVLQTYFLDNEMALLLLLAA